LNLPPGAIAVFDQIVVFPGSSTTLTINNLNGLFGTYTPTVRGTSTTGSKDAIFSITLLAPPASAPTLTSPANNTTDVVITPTLDWQSVSGTTMYEYQVAYDNAFNSIAASGSVVNDIVQITSPLAINQQFYWRTRANNSCGSGPWSSAFSFTTGSCFQTYSTNVPLIISASGTPTINSTLNNAINMTISDVNVVGLVGTHTWIDDLKFTLISPQGTSRLFWNQPCSNHDDFNINFDDEAANSNWPCPPTNGLTYIPDGLLNVFDGQQASGIWTMQVQDVANQDGGSLNGWGLKVCGTINCQLLVNQATGTGVGSLPAAIACANPGDTVTISASLANQTINIGANPLSINKSLVILAQGANTTITGTGLRIFTIPSAVQLELNGVNVIAGTSMIAGAIDNKGILKLKNVIVDKNTGVNGATLIENTSGGQLTVIGSCSINQ
jgi:subtilisin-like proprotein convertase family protein